MTLCKFFPLFENGADGIYLSRDDLRTKLDNLSSTWCARQLQHSLTPSNWWPRELWTGRACLVPTPNPVHQMRCDLFTSLNKIKDDVNRHLLFWKAKHEKRMFYSEKQTNKKQKRSCWILEVIDSQNSKTRRTRARFLSRTWVRGA